MSTYRFYNFKFWVSPSQATVRNFITKDKRPPVYLTSVN